MSERDGVVVGARYRHWKGRVYEVLAVARDEANPDRRLVVYRGDESLGNEGRGTWAREIGDFLAEVDARSPEGEVIGKQPRFAMVEESLLEWWTRSMSMRVQRPYLEDRLRGAVERRGFSFVSMRRQKLTDATVLIQTGERSFWTVTGNAPEDLTHAEREDAIVADVCKKLDEMVVARNVKHEGAMLARDSKGVQTDHP